MWSKEEEHTHTHTHVQKKKTMLRIHSYTVRRGTLARMYALHVYTHIQMHSIMLAGS